MSYLPPNPPRDVSWYGTPQSNGARCDLCPLKGNVFVPYQGPRSGGKPRLVLVGEGPGRKEEMERTPFCGITGRQLNQELKKVGLDRDEAHVTNAAMCASDDDRENARAAECCAPRLLKELAALDPSAPIIPLGKAAVKSVLGVNSVLLARGFVWTARSYEDSLRSAEGTLRKLQKDRRAGARKKQQDARLRVQTLTQRHKLAGRTVLPTLHPTFAFIHNELWAPIFSIDLDRAARWIKGELTADMLADNITRVDSLKKLAKKPRTFIVTDSPSELATASKILGSTIACDIETERIKPLSPLRARVLCVQLSDGKRSVVIAPWDSRMHAEPLTEFLRGRTVIYHNGFCFDQPALEKEGVSFDEVDLQDTLTAHHTFASCFPQKLDHVVATFLDSSPWKIRHGVRGAEEKGLSPTKGDDGDLYLYGATDAVLTKLAWDELQGDLAPEKSVYETDKRRSILYKSMQVAGYPVDRRRQRLLSKKLKRRGAALVGLLRKLSRNPNFRPSRLTDVRRALFTTLKAPMLSPTPTGQASTSNATLESLREGTGTRVARFSEALLNWRFTMKVKSTYTDTIPIHPDGRAHYNFKPFGVITGRPASRILSAPRWSKALPERFREIFCAAPGRELVYFDLAQAEARFAANLSADANFIEACAKDIHTKNALILFPDAAEMLTRDPKGKHCPRHSEGGSSSAACNCGKPFRDVTKNAGFAIIYQAAPAKVFAYLRSQGFPVEMGDVEEMFSAMRGKYFEHDRWVKDMLRFATEHGYLRTPLVGRIIRLGFHPKPTDVSNVPVQAGIADVMDTRLLNDITPALPPDVCQIMHHYDSATFDCPKGKAADEVQALIERVWAAPVKLPASIVCRKACEFVLPAEVKRGRRWSDF